jgi:hypothetical protein
VTEGLCHHCNEWQPLYRNKKRFAHNYGGAEQAMSGLLDTTGCSTAPMMISNQPLKIAVGRNWEGEIVVPAGLSVSKMVLKEVKGYESGVVGGVWWKHAHKCHAVKSAE